MEIHLEAALPLWAFVTHPLIVRAPTGISAGSGSIMTDIFFDSFVCISAEIVSRIFGSSVAVCDEVVVVSGAAAVLLCGHACAESTDVSVRSCHWTANRSTTAVCACEPG